MKDNKHIKSFNEATENLNISDVMSKLKSRLRELENEHTEDEWADGANFGRIDMIEEVMKMIEELSKNYS
jgi:hypothetical protein